MKVLLAGAIIGAIWFELAFGIGLLAIQQSAVTELEGLMLIGFAWLTIAVMLGASHIVHAIRENMKP